jgi:hypothetical protein
MRGYPSHSPICSQPISAGSSPPSAILSVLRPMRGLQALSPSRNTSSIHPAEPLPSNTSFRLKSSFATSVMCFPRRVPVSGATTGQWRGRRVGLFAVSFRCGAKDWIGDGDWMANGDISWAVPVYGPRLSLLIDLARSFTN